MSHAYLSRSLEPVLARAVREFPSVILMGPRQSGKTTLLQHRFSATHAYVSLDAPDARAAASEDPRGFLNFHAPPVIIDEVQHAPALLPYIKERIDTERHAKGRYLLTGSQNLLLSEKVTETLAGRAAILTLLPLSNREIDGQPDRPLYWQESKEQDAGKIAFGTRLWERLLRGGYPEVVTEPDRDLWLWQQSYMQTYLERDVRALRQVGDLTEYQAFMRLLAARSASLLSLSNLARDLGVAVNTVKAWLSILEATYQIIILRPYHANLGKRMVKAPKVYFSDPGILCNLCGLKDPIHAAQGPMGGAIFETAVVSEVVRSLTHQGGAPRVYFWRTQTGDEVDLIVDTPEGPLPIEVKLSETPKRAYSKGIDLFRKRHQAPTLNGYVVHPGDAHLPLVEGVRALPFGEL